MSSNFQFPVSNARGVYYTVQRDGKPIQADRSGLYLAVLSIFLLFLLAWYYG